MLRKKIFLIIAIPYIVTSASGCALGVAEHVLGDNVATHEGDQSTVSGNQGNF